MQNHNPVFTSKLIIYIQVALACFREGCFIPYGCTGIMMVYFNFELRIASVRRNLKQERGRLAACLRQAPSPPCYRWYCEIRNAEAAETWCREKRIPQKSRKKAVRQKCRFSRDSRDFWSRWHRFSSILSPKMEAQSVILRGFCIGRFLNRSLGIF